MTDQPTQNAQTPQSSANKPTHHVYDGKGNRIGIGWKNEYGGVNTIKSAHSVDGREYVRDIELFKQMRATKQAQSEQPAQAPTMQP